MKKLKVIVRPSSKGLWAEVETLKGCFSTGNNFSELREMLHEAISLHIEGLEEDGEEVPAYIKKGNYDFQFTIDLQDLFEEFPVTIQGVAERAGMNRTLLHQYASGNKTLSQNQALRIQKAIHEIGKDLMQISFGVE